jgi:hypothetical protein
MNFRGGMPLPLRGKVARAPPVRKIKFSDKILGLWAETFNREAPSPRSSLSEALRIMRVEAIFGILYSSSRPAVQ